MKDYLSLKINPFLNEDFRRGYERGYADAKAKFITDLKYLQKAIKKNKPLTDTTCTSDTEGKSYNG